MFLRSRSRPIRAALVVAVLLSLGLPQAVAAHAELVRSTPDDGETVQGSPRVIRAFFSEELADGSSMVLLDDGGATVAEGAIDPADPTRMRIDPPELVPGDYEVQWKAFADDGHLETGTFTFTVSALVTNEPSLPPIDSPEPSDASSLPPATASPPVASEPPTASPTPNIDATNAAESNDVLLPIIVAVVVIGLLGGYLLLRRRPGEP